MGFRTICDCDGCGDPIDATDKLPAKVNVYPPTSREVGHQQDEHQLCDTCWAKLCLAFPKFKEAERFAVVQPPPPPRVALPPAMDTWSQEQKESVLLLIGEALGVAVKRTTEEPKKE